MNIRELQADCHARALAAGWWKEYIAGNTMLRMWFILGKIALVHSELSEALEGHRKGLMDDHLPHRRMIEVEFADTIIRILDISGMLQLDVAGFLPKIVERGLKMDWPNTSDPTVRKHFIAGCIERAHRYVSNAFEGTEMDGSVIVSGYRFAQVIDLLCEMAAMLGLDIEGAMREKMAYNAVRPDHKAEVRAMDGGKSL